MSLGDSLKRIHILIPTSFHFSRYLRCKNLLTMESWQHSSFEENVDLDTIVLSSSDIYSSTGVQESNSGIKEEQFEDITGIIDISADNDVKTEKVKLMEEKSAINRIEFPKGHMKSECIYKIINFPKFDRFLP